VFVPLACVPVLALSNLGKSWTGDRAALAWCSFEVHAGEPAVVVGPSGSGKSTLLHLIAGLTGPTEGGVSLDGRDLARTAPGARRVAMVFQDAALYPHLSVRRNLELGPDLAGLGGDESRRRAESAAASVGAAHLLDRAPGTLSGGERQRVALARALARDPAVLLLDEPLAGLDPPARLELRALLRSLYRTIPAAVVHVTHDHEEALALGGRVVVLMEGRPEQVGTPEEVYGRPATARVGAFLGTPPMNLVLGRVDGECVFVPESAPGCTLRVPGATPGPCVLGLRPQDAALIESSRGGAWAVEVRGVEWLGHSTDVVVSAQGLTLRVRCPGRWAVGPGAPAWLAPDPARAHLFEPGVPGLRRNADASLNHSHRSPA
jgi:ABC-type sugar transport system ATPase subunit